jgi:hypothetical protein
MMTSVKKAKLGCLFNDEIDELFKKASSAKETIQYSYGGRVIDAKLIPLSTSLNRCRGICCACDGDDYLNCPTCKDWKPTFGIAFKVRDGEWRKAIACPGQCGGKRCAFNINGKQYCLMLIGQIGDQFASMRTHIQKFHNTLPAVSLGVGGLLLKEEEEENDAHTTDSLIDDDNDDVILRTEIMMLTSRIDATEGLKEKYDIEVFAPCRDTEGPIILETTNLIKQLVKDLKGAEEKLGEATDALKKAEVQRASVFKLLDAALEKDNAELDEKTAALDLKNLSQ